MRLPSQKRHCTKCRCYSEKVFLAVNKKSRSARTFSVASEGRRVFVSCTVQISSTSSSELSLLTWASALAGYGWVALNASLVAASSVYALSVAKSVSSARKSLNVIRKHKINTVYF